MLAAIQAGFPVNQHLRDGSTPLFVAAMWGQDRIVDALIDAGAYVNLATKNHTRQSPLHAATQWGWKAISHRLIAAGASVQSVDGMKATPLHMAHLRGLLRFADFYLKRARTSAPRASSKVLPLCTWRLRPAHKASRSTRSRSLREKWLRRVFTSHRESHMTMRLLSLCYLSRV